MDLHEARGEIKAVATDPSRPFHRTRAAAWSLMLNERLPRQDGWRAAEIATRPGDLAAPDAWRVRAMADKVQP